MSIWRSIVNWFRKNKKVVEKKINNPSVNHEFAIEDSEQVIRDSKSKLAGFMAAQRKLDRELSEVKADVDKWKLIAEKAQSSGDVASVALANEERAKAQEQAIALHKQSKANEQSIENFRTQIDNAERGIEQAKQKHVQLEARLGAVSLRNALSGSLNDLENAASPLAQLSELEQEVIAQEDLAEAREDLSTSKSETVAAKYAVRPNVNEEYEALFK